MPAEWTPHEATWIAWPHRKSDWPGKFEPIRWAYGEFARLVSSGERLRILVSDAAARAEARAVLAKSGAKLDMVDFIPCPTDRSWARDFCPIFVHDRDGRIVATDWKFNGWAKYRNWARDNGVPEVIAARLRLPRVAIDRVLEGGAIDVNGRGTLLATEECLLDTRTQVRNPGMSRAETEAMLAEYLGVSKVLWLARGIAADDTHGHIDDVARFVDARTVVTVVEEDREDENFEATQQNLRDLERMSDQNGKPLKVVPLPMPKPVWFNRQRLPASYANFYIANGLVLVPTFNDPADRIALNTLARLFKGRQVIGFHSVDLLLGLGTLHCMTQQQPTGR
jgi:agmatine deiminase